jgi:hypothetical protein
MPTINEIASWTLEEIRIEILKILPAGWSFREGREERWVQAAFFKTGSPETPPYWSDTHMDPRLLLLNAFGWLWVRCQKPKHPVWRPRSAPSRVVARPTIPQVPDPSDLDPQRIRQVYEEKSKKRK